MSPELTLYGYFRSSAVFRVRIALNLKGIVPLYAFIHLLKEGGQQHSAAYKELNPQEIIPTLVHDGHPIGQSLAIIEYLDEIAPTPPLLPSDPPGRARVRQLAYAVACEIHPVNNLRVSNYLRDKVGATPEALRDWHQHWIALGFEALETMLSGAKETGRYCHGDQPTLADICLIPQMANARRVSLDLAPYPTLLRIEEAALAHPAFDAALPKNQPDAE
jgi:maleylacetoacetate isomerase